MHFKCVILLITHCGACNCAKILLIDSSLWCYYESAKRKRIYKFREFDMVNPGLMIYDMVTKLEYVIHTVHIYTSEGLKKGTHKLHFTDQTEPTRTPYIQTFFITDP